MMRSGQILNRSWRQSQEYVLTDWAWGVSKRESRMSPSFWPELLEGCRLLRWGKIREKQVWGRKSVVWFWISSVQDAFWYPRGDVKKSIEYKTLGKARDLDLGVTIIRMQFKARRWNMTIKQVQVEKRSRSKRRSRSSVLGTPKFRGWWDEQRKQSKGNLRYKENWDRVDPEAKWRQHFESGVSIGSSANEKSRKMKTENWTLEKLVSWRWGWSW